MKIVKLVHLEKKLDVGWQYEFPHEPDLNLEDLTFVLFDDGNGFQLAMVDAWSNTLELIPNGTSRRHKLRFSHIRGLGSHLEQYRNYCDRPLSLGEIDECTRLAKSGTSRPHVDEDEHESTLALGMEEARAAVARYYHVKAEQIEMTIKSAGEVAN
ncbi:hypothetical protein [Pseudomonas viridiflava]